MSSSNFWWRAFVHASNEGLAALQTKKRKQKQNTRSAVFHNDWLAPVLTIMKKKLWGDVRWGCINLNAQVTAAKETNYFTMILIKNPSPYETIIK